MLGETDASHQYIARCIFFLTQWGLEDIGFAWGCKVYGVQIVVFPMGITWYCQIEGLSRIFFSYEYTCS